jgi:hypothetical protein
LRRVHLVQRATQARLVGLADQQQQAVHSAVPVEAAVELARRSTARRERAEPVESTAAVEAVAAEQQQPVRAERPGLVVRVRRALSL